METKYKKDAYSEVVMVCSLDHRIYICMHTYIYDNQHQVVQLCFGVDDFWCDFFLCSISKSRLFGPFCYVLFLLHELLLLLCYSQLFNNHSVQYFGHLCRGFFSRVFFFLSSFISSAIYCKGFCKKIKQSEGHRSNIARMSYAQKHEAIKRQKSKRAL